MSNERLLETLRAFIAAPSPQTDLDRVRAFIREVVRPRLPAAYFDEIRLDPDGNLLALKRGYEPSRPFLLGAYAATFPAEGMADAFVPKEVDGAAYGASGPAMRGRGVSEQVAALAAAVEALWRLAESGHRLRGSLLFAVTIAGEMGSHEVVDAMARRGDLEAASGLLAAGTGNALCLGNLGRVDVEVDVRGRSCHSSDPDRGLNALEGACQVLQRLRAVPLGYDPDLGHATLTATRLETWPRASHTVPDLARLTLDRRLVPGEMTEQALADMTAAIGALEPYATEVRAGKANLPNKVTAEDEVAVRAFRALFAATGVAVVTYWRAALDAGYLTRRGTPTVMLGPGDMRFAHTDEEAVPVRQVLDAAEIYRRLIADLCAAEPP